MAQPIPPEFVYDLISVVAPALSPDGTRLAWVRSAVDREEMEYRTEIMMAQMPGGPPRSFTRGPADSEPRFSPDGNWIAFLRPDGNGIRQIWLIDLCGGEARQVTSGPADAAGHSWSPDSRSLAFVSKVDPDWLPPDHDHKRDPRVRVARRIRYRHDERGWIGDAFNQLFVVDLESGETRQLTDGEGDCSGPVWSPRGDRLAYLCDEVEDRDFNNHSEARVIAASGGRPQTWSAGLWRVLALAWAADGSRLAASGTHDVLMWDPRQASIFILDPGKQARHLTDDSYTTDPQAPEIRWATDGNIWFVGDRHGESFLCRVDPGGNLTALAGGGVKYTGWALDDEARNAVLVEMTSTAADNLVGVDLSTGARVRLTEYNAPYLEEHPPAAMEKFTLERGGERIECRVLLPPGFDPGRRYPLVLDIHGGPHGRFCDGFDPFQQVMATAGYAVLGVNPRGSSSYGLEFAKMVLGDWGGEDYRDIMASVDAVCSREYIDEDRIAVHGVSYGGYMASWIIGHETRFRAALVGAPCTNLYSMYGTSDIGVSFFEANWAGTAEELRDALLAHSPITYADNVTTPVLLFHGENDLRCPVEQSEQYFVALKRLGRKVEFVRFPDSPHGFRKSGHPRLRVEYSRRILDWLERHL